MFARRALFASLPVWLLLGTPAFAGAPELNETCRDQNGAPVRMQLSTSTRFFAETGRARAPTSRGDASMYIIYINPERTFLGRPTQQWLYLRQCAHIRERHPVINEGERALSVRDEEMADCWAARELVRGGESPKTLYVIESDMARLIRDRRWGEVLPGPERRISLLSCAK